MQVHVRDHGRQGAASSVAAIAFDATRDDLVVVAGAVDLELAAVPRQDLGLRAGKAVGLAGGQLGAVALSRAGQHADLDRRLGHGEAPF